jgi:hypothetical protein
MKKIISLTMVLFILANVARAQTTWEDYRYVTAGLKDDIRKGKEVKSGYFLEEIGKQVNIGSRNTQLYSFKKGTQLRAYVLWCWDNSSIFSLCIPTGSAGSDLWDKYYKDLQSVDGSWHLLYSWAFSLITAKKQ